MNPTASGIKGTNTHSYPAYDYPVGIGTGLIACKDGTLVDFPGQPTRKLMGNLNNGQAWSEYIANAQNSGNVITIFHGNGEYTCYLHASPFDANAYRGKQVKQGEVFARSGHNGWSTGPHLHFEVWKNGSRIDPGVWLNNIQGVNVTPPVNTGDIINFWPPMTGHGPSIEDGKVWIGADWKKFAYDKVYLEMVANRKRIIELEAQLAKESTILKPGKYVVPNP